MKWKFWKPIPAANIPPNHRRKYRKRRKVPQQVLGFTLLTIEPDTVLELFKASCVAQHLDPSDPVIFQTFQANLGSPNSLWFRVTQGEYLVGLASISDIQEGYSCVAHITYFDRRTKGREAATRQFIDTLISSLRLQVMYAFPSVRHLATPGWLKRMGFKCDGKLRLFIKHGITLEDAWVYSLTPGSVYHHGGNKPYCS